MTIASLFPSLVRLSPLRQSRSVATRLRGKLLALLLAGFAAAAAPPAATACTGDCDTSLAVTVDEIVLGVNIALGVGRLQDCRSFDSDGSNSVTVDEIITALGFALQGCPAPTATPSSTPPPTPTPTPSPSPTEGIRPIFPANYRDTYTEVRACRPSVEHGGVYIRVLANPIGAQPYLEDGNPLPVGSIIIKEEFSGPGCRNGELIRWRVMRKEEAGFDPADGDWSWQWVNINGEIVFNDKATCIGCHNRPECVARDFQCTVPGSPLGELALVLREQPAALLSISGRSENDVIAVGADPDDSFGPLVLHYNGARWKRLKTGAQGDLWWISVEPIDGDFYLSGENGLVLRLDPDRDIFETLPVPADVTLYGIWGTSANDIWAVGGPDENPSTGGFLAHFDGTEWTAVDTNTIREGGIPLLFKVWGRATNDIYAVGQKGTIVHYDGESWSEMVSNTVRPLFTVHGNATSVVATGGFVDGVIMEKSGDEFVRRDDEAIPQMNGVFVGERGIQVAVGISGSAAARDEMKWSVIDTQVNSLLDFHATWLDPQGGVWAVGGDLSLALDRGMLAYGGSLTISSVVEEIPPCQPGALSPNATVSYSNDILPLFSRTGCLSVGCHASPFPSSAYDLRSYENTFGQGILARVLGVCDVVPGNPDASFLVEKLQATPRLGVQMPAGLPPLSQSDIDLIRTWILEGAGDDREPTPTPTPMGAATPTPPSTNLPAPTLPQGCSVAGNVCTIVGTGLARFDGDGKAGTRTSLYFPIDVEFDPNGNLLVLDWNNLRLRKLGNDNRITTIMGSDIEQLPVDGALARDTSLHHASDLAFDSAGQMFLAGDHAPVVFRVGLDDRVRTIAGNGAVGYSGDGGPARSASIATPFGVYADAAGGVYIADVASHVVRYVEPGGVIQTIAGTGALGYSGDGGPAAAATLTGPVRVTEHNGEIYIVEAYNHVIRKIDANGMISTVVGTGADGYSGDGGPARQARLNEPYDVQFGSDGSMYIADSGNAVIRRVAPNGTITTIAGTGTSGFSGDNGPASLARFNCPSSLKIDAQGSLWVADSCNHRVRRIYLGAAS